MHSEKDVEIGDVVNHVWEAVLDHLGTKGASKIGFWVIGNRFDEEEQEGVIRVRKGHEDDLRAALTLADTIRGSRGFIEVTQISGSISGLEDQ